MSHNTALLCIIIPKTLANAIGKENITYVKWEGRNLTVFIDDTKELSKKKTKKQKNSWIYLVIKQDCRIQDECTKVNFFLIYKE